MATLTRGTERYYLSFILVVISDPWVRNLEDTDDIDANKKHLSDWISGEIPTPFRVKMDPYFTHTSEQQRGFSLFFIKNALGAYEEQEGQRNQGSYHIMYPGAYRLATFSPGDIGYAQDLFFRAKLADPQIYTITYHLNGGTCREMPTSYLRDSLPLILPAPSREGYEFEGWYEYPDFKGKVWYFLHVGSKGNKEYWAKWGPIRYR